MSNGRFRTLSQKNSIFMNQFRSRLLIRDHVTLDQSFARVFYVEDRKSTVSLKCFCYYTTPCATRGNISLSLDDLRRPLFAQHGLEDLQLTSAEQADRARQHLADHSQQQTPTKLRASGKNPADPDLSKFATSITAPLEESVIPFKLASTLEQIVGQLDMLTQVSAGRRALVPALSSGNKNQNGFNAHRRIIMTVV